MGSSQRGPAAGTAADPVVLDDSDDEASHATARPAISRQSVSYSSDDAQRPKSPSNQHASTGVVPTGVVSAGGMSTWACQDDRDRLQVHAKPGPSTLAYRTHYQHGGKDGRPSQQSPPPSQRPKTHHAGNQQVNAPGTWGNIAQTVTPEHVSWATGERQHPPRRTKETKQHHVGSNASQPSQALGSRGNPVHTMSSERVIHATGELQDSHHRNGKDKLSHVGTSASQPTTTRQPWTDHQVVPRLAPTIFQTTVVDHSGPSSHPHKSASRHQALPSPPLSPEPLPSSNGGHPVIYKQHKRRIPTSPNQGQASDDAPSTKVPRIEPAALTKDPLSPPLPVKKHVGPSWATSEQPSQSQEGLTFPPSLTKPAGPSTARSLPSRATSPAKATSPEKALDPGAGPKRVEPLFLSSEDSPTFDLEEYSAEPTPLFLPGRSESPMAYPDIKPIIESIETPDEYMASPTDFYGDILDELASEEAGSLFEVEEQVEEQFDQIPLWSEDMTGFVTEDSQDPPNAAPGHFSEAADSGLETPLPRNASLDSIDAHPEPAQTAPHASRTPTTRPREEENTEKASEMAPLGPDAPRDIAVSMTSDDEDTGATANRVVREDTSASIEEIPASEFKAKVAIYSLEHGRSSRLSAMVPRRMQWNYARQSSSLIPAMAGPGPLSRKAALGVDRNDITRQPPEDRRGVAKRQFNNRLVDEWNRLLPGLTHNPPLHRAIFEAYIAEQELESGGISIVNTIDQKGAPPDFEFEYSNEMLYHRHVPDPEKGLGCGCDGPCDPKSKTCSCLKRQQLYFYSLDIDGFAYDEKGLAKNLSTPIWECSDTCGCPPECMNRVIQRRRNPSTKLEIVKTRRKGWGIQAKNFIPRGTFIGIYAGELITEHESERRGKLYSEIGRTYLFDLDGWQIANPPAGLGAIDPRLAEIAEASASRAARAVENDDDPHYVYNAYSVDAFHYGYTRFFNHSCDPNLEITQCYVKDFHPERPLLVIFTRRDVKSREELCISYKGILDEDEVPDTVVRVETKTRKEKTRRSKTSTLARVTTKDRMKSKMENKCFCMAPNCDGRMFNL